MTSARISSTIASILISFLSYPKGSSNRLPIPSMPYNVNVTRMTIGTAHQLIFSTRAKGNTAPKRASTCFWWILAQSALRLATTIDTNVQMSNRNTSQPNSLHPPIRIRQRVQLHLHLTSLRPMKRPLIKLPLYILLHKKRQLQRQPHPPMLQSLQPMRQQLAILRH